MYICKRTGQHRSCYGKVASTPGSIGYVSLDVLDDTVKALKLEGVEPTAENIKAGNYFLSRPFVMATKGEISEQSEPVQALFDYLSSAEGKRSDQLRRSDHCRLTGKNEGLV